jgi:uncharacterized membrane protein
LDPYVHDWLNLLVRWAHFVFGVAWIGASFYFVWLNNTLRPPDPPREGVEGELWAVHGGGYYRVSKHDPRMPAVPEPLHWFKWEAYLTFLTGFALLVVVYWLRPETFLVGGSPMGLSPGAGIAVSAATLGLGWLGYHGLCLALEQRPRALAAIGSALIVLVSWGLSELLAPRAAWLHVGAMLGTCMAANVLFVIIPGQKAMVAATAAGRPVDVRYGKRAALRSLHNNYLTLPVLCVMISNHFPMAYGHAWSWLLLAGLFVAGGAIRHWVNLHERGVSAHALLPAAALGIIAMAFVTRPAPPAAGDAPSFAEVRAVIQARCVSCHAATPTFPGIVAPPLGFRLDDDASIVAGAPRILTQAVTSQVMPLGNATKMTDDERALLGRWIAAGAATE